ncbi:MAG: adenylate/guanylate cyclase domain-containing protein, partial [Spirochaetales bacterium]|nr:adenylate/guanylate cyclase domain-containing protein [Spirochaetales bacterium]
MKKEPLQVIVESMDRSLFEERLRLCADEVGWPLDSVKSAWDRLYSLEFNLRSTLTPARLGQALELDQETALRFLLAGFRAGLLETRWQIFQPISGWIVEETSSVGSLTGEILYDPFSRETVEPDLGTNILVVFRPSVLFFEDCTVSCTYQSWESYRNAKMAWPFASDPGTSPLAFKPFSPWELGKIEVIGKPGEVLRLICLETRSQLTLRVGGKTSVPGESFILKMENFRTLKAQETTIQQTLDLLLTPQGFEQKELEVSPGKLLIWLENRSTKSAGLSVWRSPVLPGPQPLLDVWNARSVINHPLARQNLVHGQLPDGFHLRISGEAFLFAGFEDSTRLMDEKGDKEFFSISRRAVEQLVEVSQELGGFVVHKELDVFTLVFPSPLAASQAAVRMQAPGQEFSSIWKFTIFTGNVLLTPGDTGIRFFGYSINLGRKLLDRVRGGELWVSMSAFGSKGVPDFFLSSGYECTQETVSIKKDEQLSVVYE